MGARHKLNKVHFAGIFLFAAVLGCLTGSSLIFFVTIGIFVYLAIDGGDIRMR